MNQTGKQLLCAILSFLLAFTTGSVPLQAQTGANPIQKASYQEILPEAAPVADAEINRFLTLADTSIQDAAAEINSCKDSVFLSVVRGILNAWYADISSVNRTSIDRLKELLAGRADSIFAGYEASLAERIELSLKERPEYVPTDILICFELGTSFEEMKEIADRMGGSIEILDGKGTYIEIRIANGEKPSEKFHTIVALRTGIAYSTQMAMDLLNQLDSVYLTERNGLYYLDDPMEDLPNPPIYHPIQPVLKKGRVYAISKMNYKVINAQNKTVSLIGTKYKSLQNLTVPSTVVINGQACKVVSVGAKAFQNIKSLKKVTFGKNILSIGKNAFAGCSRLKNIYFQGSRPKTTGKNAFWKINSKAIFRTLNKIR